MNFRTDELRRDRGITLARRHLKKHLKELLAPEAAPRILALAEEADQVQHAIQTEVPNGDAKRVWRDAVAAVAAGKASEEQRIIAGKSLASWQAWVADSMHLRKERRRELRELLTKACNSGFRSPAPLLESLAVSLEESWRKWHDGHGVPADPKCPLAEEVRQTGSAGWLFNGLSTPLSADDEMRKVLEAAA